MKIEIEGKEPKQKIESKEGRVIGTYFKLTVINLTMNGQKLATLLVIMSIALTALTQTTGTVTDPRDGQIYNTVRFEIAPQGTNVTWMAQNLNYKVDGSYAYDNNESYRKAYGLLYTWEAAKKACPNGWHLATHSEWSMLVSEFGGRDRAGESLKSNKGWNDDGNGTNSSGFNALPAGYRSTIGEYGFLGEIGYWWTSTSASEGDAWRWKLYHFNSEAPRYDDSVSNGFSVRCVQD